MFKGTQEEKQILKLEKMFNKMVDEVAKQRSEGIVYSNGIQESKQFDKKHGDYWEIETGKDIFKDISNKKVLMNKAFDYLTNGNTNFEIITDTVNGEEIQFRRISGDEYTRGKSNNILSTEQYKQKLRMAPSVDDLIINSNAQYHSPLTHENNKFPNGFNNYHGIVGIDNNLFRYIVRIGNTNKNDSVFYDVSLEYLGNKKGNTHEVHQTDNSSSLVKRVSPLDANNITQNTNNVNNDILPVKTNNTQQSKPILNNQGRKLTEQQQEYFKDSKIKTPNNELRVMYHATPNEFTIFDKNKANPNGGHGSGFYFTTAKDHASGYGGKIGEYYLNITNPLNYSYSNQYGKNDTKQITKQQLSTLVNEMFNNEDYSMENYGYGKTVEDIVNDLYNKNSDYEMLMDLNLTAVGDMTKFVEYVNETIGTNYDGILTDYETVAFNSNQIKRIDNLNPTTNEDINLSLSNKNDIAPYNPNLTYSEDVKIKQGNTSYNGNLNELLSYYNKNISIDDLSSNVVEAQLDTKQERHDKYARQLGFISNKDIKKENTSTLSP